jgi:hypothetical protein
MTMFDDLRIEEAVAKALEGSADQRALALLAAAGDPEGCRKRIAELTAATKAHDVARAALDLAVETAQTEQAAAAARLTEVAQREAEFLQWKTREEARLKQTDADVRAGEAANARHAGELAFQSAAINNKVGRHVELIETMRRHVAEADAAAARALEGS